MRSIKRFALDGFARREVQVMEKHAGKIAKAAASAALAMALAFGGVAPSVALADVGTGTGTITVTTTKSNNGMTYNAYKIFTCDVDGGVVTEIDWASDGVETAVLEAIEKKNPDYSGETAQDAADFIRTNISDTTSTTRVEAGSFADDLSKAIGGVTDPAPTVLTAGESKTGMAEGYYLIVSKADSLTEGRVGTSPIFTLLGEGQSLEVGDKASVPVLEKTLVEDSAPSEKRVYADAQVGQDVSYTLKGTVSDNIASFASYKYVFEDQLPAGMDLKGGASGITVKINTSETEYVPTSGYTANFENNKLTVDFTDLKLASDGTDTIPVDASSEVTVTYSAFLDSGSTSGLALGTTAGNVNTATLTYANNPQDTETTSSVAQAATVYTFGLDLVKVDKEKELDDDNSTNTKLADAKFTIQAKTTDENPDSDGRYLKTDGAFGDKTDQPTATDEGYVFTTDANGEFSVRGLDAGTYVIHELVAPTNYDLLSSDLELTIGVTKDEEGKPTAVTATLTGGEADGADSDNDNVTDKGTRAAYDSDTGIVTITATNAKGASLPLTGLSGITGVYVAGGAILVVSLTVLVRRRLKAKA